MTGDITDRVAVSLNSTAAEEGGEWIHLLPAGTFHGRDGRGPYTLSDPEGVIRSSRHRAGRRMIPVDYDHQIEFAAKNGTRAPAAGWIDALQARADGIWARVKWTERAAAHLAAREYRYISPVFVHRGDGRVLTILSAGLTNDPNLDQLTAIASMETPMDLEALLAELRTVLGLGADVPAAAILDQLRRVVTSAHAASAPDPTEYVPIGDFERAVAEVNRLNQGISVQAAAQHVELQIRNGNMPPALKDWGVALCSVNKVAFDSFIERTRGAFNRMVDPKDISRRPPDQRSSRLDATERAICSRMGISEAELMNARSFTRTTSE